VGFSEATGGLSPLRRELEKNPSSQAFIIKSAFGFKKITNFNNSAITKEA
jgi:hypothetical protein